MGQPDIMEEALRETFGTQLEIYAFDTIDSTNAEAKRRIRAGLTRPALFLADTQTAGRGRLGRTFYSPEETGIYMTLAYPADVPFDSAVRVTAKASVAVFEGIQSVMNVALSIKWVNDIYRNDRKVAGILVESVADEAGEKVSWLVIGIGINVNTETFPEEIRETAGALTQGKCPKERLIVPIVEHLLTEVGDLEDRSYLETYRNASCVLGKKILYGQIPELRRGTAVEIDDTGALIVINENGEKERLYTGEISVRPDGKETYSARNSAPQDKEDRL